MGYVLLRQDMLPDAWVARAGESPDFAVFLEGRRLLDIEEPLSVELGEESEVPTDYFEWPYFMVSDKMRKALEEFGVDNIDYYRVNLLRFESDEVIAKYWLGNILGVVSCVDRGGSEFQPISSSRQVLRAFRVDEARAGGVNLFRLQEDRTLVLASEDLKTHLAARGLSGIYFQETTAFDRSPASSFWGGP